MQHASIHIVGSLANDFFHLRNTSDFQKPSEGKKPIRETKNITISSARQKEEKNPSLLKCTGHCHRWRRSTSSTQLREEMTDARRPRIRVHRFGNNLDDEADCIGIMFRTSWPTQWSVAPTPLFEAVEPRRWHLCRPLWIALLYIVTLITRLPFNKNTLPYHRVGRDKDGILISHSRHLFSFSDTVFFSSSLLHFFKHRHSVYCRVAVGCSINHDHLSE